MTDTILFIMLLGALLFFVGLGLNVRADYLEEKAKKAKDDPAGIL